MEESVKDEITVRIVYEGRAAKVLLDNAKLQEIEDYYTQCAEDGASDYAIEEQTGQCADELDPWRPGRIKAVAEDFVALRDKGQRRRDGQGQGDVRCSNRPIAYQLYKEIIALRPEWAEVKVCEEGAR